MRQTIDGRTVGYSAGGARSRRTLVFLHYFGGSSRAWSAVTARLPRNRRWVAIDLPGFGDSDPQGAGWSVESAAVTVERLLDRLDVKEQTLVGHSMGGKLALVMAARRPERVSSLVLVSPSPPWPEPDDSGSRRRLLYEHGDRAAMTTLLDGLAPAPLDPTLRNQAIDDHLRTFPQAWRWWLTAGVQEDVTKLIADLDVPTLVLAGTEDPAIARDVHERLARTLKAARLVTVKNVGHLLPLEAPDVLADVLAKL